jgi:REP element-mobilizing transposase RayT
MGKYIHKSHNVSVLVYHLVCPTKYRRAIFTPEVTQKLKEICLEISERHEIHFLEIGTDQDHTHFLIQSVPMYSPKQIAQIIKSLTARKMFEWRPELRKQLWGSQFWTDGYYVSSVGQHGNETTIATYVRNQGTDKTYKQILKQQLTLF